MTASNPNAIVTSVLPICIANEWRLGTGEYYITRCPATGEAVAELDAASIANVEETVAGAYRALLSSSWVQHKPHRRMTVLCRVVELIHSRSEALTQHQQLDNSRPINETRALMASATATFQFFGAACEMPEESLIPMCDDCPTTSVHELMGVMAAITSWDSPITSEAQKMASALVTGNAVVVKPAEITPLMALELIVVCEEAGVPKGTINVLPGGGSVIGDAITEHQLVRHMSSTGGMNTGRHITHIVIDKVMPVSLELGGGSPTMVLEDADLDHAVSGILCGIFSSSDEPCVAGSHLFVVRLLYEPSMGRLAATTARPRVGNLTDESTQMGPLITDHHHEIVESYAAMGAGGGSHLRTDGLRPVIVGCESGYFYIPTIIEGLVSSTCVCQEGIFGPALVVTPFDDKDKLIEQINDSVYALVTGVWTRGYRRTQCIGCAMQVGSMWINTCKQFSISMPFGSWHDSGLGRGKGRPGILRYMGQKNPYWGLNEQSLAWASAS